MSSLEGRVQYHLLPWLNGFRTRLDVPTQELIATWATKTAMMLQFLGKRRPIPTSHFDQIFARKASPPDNVYVFIGIDDDQAQMPRAVYGIGTRPIIYADRRGLAPRTYQYLAYEVTVVVQYLVLVVIGHEGRPLPKRLGDLLTVPSATRVWPPVSSMGVQLP